MSPQILKKLSKIDKQEFEIPETLYERDIENRVFQGIVLQCLSQVEGIALLEGSFIDHILGRDSLEGIKGIHTEQDSKHQTVSIRVEINIAYGIPIPKKAEEVQVLISEKITELTGLHVSSIHVVFKNMIPQAHLKTVSEVLDSLSTNPASQRGDYVSDESRD